MAVWSTVLLSETLRHGRQDADFYQPHFLALQARMEGLSREGKARPLCDVASVEYGYMPMQDYVEPLDGEPLLRVTNLKNNLEVDDSDLVYVPRNLGIPDKKRLQPRDVLLVQCGDTTGKVGQVGAEHNGMLFPSFCLRIRSRGSFPSAGLALFLFSNIGQEQIRQRVTIATVRPNTSKPDVEGLVIPDFFELPELSRLLEKAHDRRRQARLLLAAAEAMLNDALGLAALDLTPRLSYEARFADASAAARLDAEYFNPRYDILLDRIHQAGDVRLGDKVQEPIERGISPVYDEDGAFTVINSQHVGKTHVILDDNRSASATAGRGTVRKYDVLLNSTGYITIGRCQCLLDDVQAIVDNHVSIIRPSEELDPVFLALFLNALPGQMQTERGWTGSSGQIELRKDTVADFRIWRAPAEIQQAIRRNVEQAHIARQESRRLLDTAKRAVEIAIEDDEGSALRFLEEAQG